MFNNLQNIFSTLIPPTVNTLSRYNLGNVQNIQTKDSCTTDYFNSFLSSSIREWNFITTGYRESMIHSVFILSVH